MPGLEDAPLGLYIAFYVIVFLVVFGVVAVIIVLGRAALTGRLGSGTTRTSLAERLGKLSELHASGGLTDDEFAAAKNRVLSED